MRRYEKWPIYATKRLVEVVPYLCLKGERHTVVANVLFHCLGSGSSDSESSTFFRNDYMETLNLLYNNRNRINGLQDPQEGSRELVFSPFNLNLVNEVSPRIYSSQRDRLISSLEESLQSFSMYYTHVKENIDLNLLFDSAGVDFLKVVKLLRLEHKLDELKGEVVDQLLKTLLASNDLPRALEFIRAILQNRELGLATPLVPSSMSLLDVLVEILKRECRSSLEAFIKVIPPELYAQCLHFLRSTNPHTGLLVHPWGYSAMELLLSNKVSEGHPKLENNKGNSNMNATSFEDSVADRLLVDSVAGLYSAFKALKDLNASACKNSHGYERSPKGLISVHFEPDLVVVSTDRDVFVIDTIIRDSLYRSSLFNLLNFICSCNLVKVGHNFMLNVAKLSCQFKDPFKSYRRIVDLNDKRMKKTRIYGPEGVHQSNEFRSTGFTKNLCGLLQQFNVPLPVPKKWNCCRPVPAGRIKYLSIVARGMLSVEYQLRSRGWMPSSICDNSTTPDGYDLAPVS